MTQLSWIPAQFIKLDQDQRADLSQYVICGIHLPPGASEGRARAWKVNADGSNAGEITIPNQGGKDDTVTCQVLADGSVRFVVSEAAAPGASGSTAVPFAYTVLGVFGPAPAGGSGGDISAPIVPAGGYVRIVSNSLDDEPLSGEGTVQLAAYSIPTTARELSIKLCVSAQVAGTRGRIGPHMDGNGAAMLTVQTQAPGQRSYGYAQLTPGAGHVLYIWAEGVVGEFFADVLWYR